MSKTRDGFTLNVVGAKFTNDQIIFLHGQSGTGKTTFINILARHVYPDTIQGDIPYLKVSYKPQCIIRNKHLSVKDVFQTLRCSSFRDPCFVSTVTEPFKVLPLMGKRMTKLSDTQLQRVGMCFCLARNAYIYLIDEPTAGLNDVQRNVAKQVIKTFIQRTKRVIVFEGTSSADCVANSPIDRN